MNGQSAWCWTASTIKGAHQNGKSGKGDQDIEISHGLALRDLAALIGMTFVAGFPTR